MLILIGQSFFATDSIFKVIMAKNQDLLIEILLDSNASLAERDDAAIDLSSFDEDAVLIALIEISLTGNLTENQIISC